MLSVQSQRKYDQMLAELGHRFEVAREIPFELTITVNCGGIYIEIESMDQYRLVAEWLIRHGWEEDPLTSHPSTGGWMMVAFQRQLDRLVLQVPLRVWYGTGS